MVKCISDNTAKKNYEMKKKIWFGVLIPEYAKSNSRRSSEMKNRNLRMLGSMLSVAMLAGAIGAVPVLAEENGGRWAEEDGAWYWYENGVKQGTEGRGKEIYDPVSDAWYWLDAEFGGRKAVSKDVYQEYADGTGKWVRYDADGHMVKGWREDGEKRWYFDPKTGAMAKGMVKIDGKWWNYPVCRRLNTSQKQK